MRGVLSPPSSFYPSTCILLALPPVDHKGWHQRGYLPHCDFADSIHAVTFRLADSLPKDLVQAWKQELEAGSPNMKSNRLELLRRIAKFEDAGYGECILRDPDCASVVQNKLIAGHGVSYKLIEWCVMPNHVHVLIGMLPGNPLGRLVQRWKGGSSVRINRYLGRNGSLWMEDYFDRFIRDQDHFLNARIYIRGNPVKAGLCQKDGDWKFSSAGVGWTAPSARAD